MRKAIAFAIAFGAASLVISNASSKNISVSIPKADVKAICNTNNGCQRCNENNCRVYTCGKKSCTVTLVSATIAPQQGKGTAPTSTSVGAARGLSNNNSSASGNSAGVVHHGSPTRMNK